MSTELVPCPCCNGKAETSDGGFGPINAQPMFNLYFVGCEDCGLLVAAKTLDEAIAAWNQRFVCLDMNGDKVFSDSKIIGTMGDGSEHECFLQYQQYQWWATDTQATFDVSMSFRLSEFEEIELIKE